MKQSVSGGNGLFSERTLSGVERIAKGARSLRLRPSMKCMALLILLAAVAVTLAGTSPARAMTLNSAPHPQTWVTNGVVYAIAQTTDTVYLGGSFSYVGPQTGQGVPLDNATGQVAGAFPRVGGTVNACIADGHGGWFIGGSFTNVGGVACSGLAHILASGELDQAWNPGAAGNVWALALSDSTLYVGGEFGSVGGQARDRIAAVDATTGLVSAWNPMANGPVLALAVVNGAVYAGGDFSRIGGKPRSCLAALDATTGAAMDWDPSPNGSVLTLAAANGVIYLGGEFSTVGGVGRNRVAAVDTVTGAVTVWEPGAFGTKVNALVISGEVVFVAGDFTAIGGQTRSGLAALDIITGDAKAWNPNPGAGIRITALAYTNGMLYVGGNFKSFGGQTRNGLAALDPVTGAVAAWNPGTDGRVLALAASNGVVYAGGEFTSVGGVTRNCLAALDRATGAAISWNPGVNPNSNNGSGVYALAVAGGALYAGGGFTINSMYSGLAALDLATGAPKPWNPSVSGVVLAFAVSGDLLYIGGTFTTAGGQPRNHLAALDPAIGAVTAWNPNANDRVTALAVADGVVYAGGNFSNIGGKPRTHLAAVDAASGAVTVWNPSPVSTDYNAVLINALVVSGDAVYVGGQFASVGGKARNGLAALDKTAGAATPWNPVLGCRFYDPVWVNALAVMDGVIYLGGFFTSVNGRTHNNVAAVDLATGLPTIWSPSVWRNTYDDYVTQRVMVKALVAKDGVVYAGGHFTNLDGLCINHLAQFSPAYTVSFRTDATPGAGLAGMIFQVVAPGADCTTVAAKAPTGHHFTRWTRDGADDSTDTLLTPTAVAADMNFVANFAVNTYAVTFRTDGTAGARISGLAAQSVNHGTSTTAVTAVAPSGYHFVKWTQSGTAYSTANPLTVRGVAGDLALTAVFALNRYTVTFKADGTRGATLTGVAAQTITYGMSATAVKANGPTGYHFVKWASGTRTYSIANPLTVSRVTANTALTAVFAINTYAVTFKTDGTRGATLAGRPTQTVNYGTSSLAVRAVAPVGYRFVKWTKAGVTYSMANPLALTRVTANTALVATFEKIKCTVTFKTDGTRGATLTGTTTQTVSYGADATAVKAVAPKGYRFVKWTQAGATYSTANPLTVTKVTGNLTLVATFKKK